MTGVGNVAVTEATRTHPAAPTGMPARIDLVQIVRGPGDTHVAADPIALTGGQLGQLNALNQTDPAYQAWFTAHGAVDADSTDIEIVVEGNRDHAVRVLGLQPIARCAPALNGTLFLSPSAGSDTSTQLLIDLDDPHALPSYIAQDNAGDITSGKDFFGAYTVSLAPAEQYTFKVVASTTGHYCTFTLAMTVLDGTQTLVERVDDNGRPFRVSAVLDQDPDHPGPGEFAAYKKLYIGGVANTDIEQNSFGDDTWAPADPASYAE
jgi:hypothetical protein